MDTQSIMNLAAGTAIAAIGWFARQLWDAVAELRKDVHEIEVALPSQYLRKDEHTAAMQRIEDMLQRIFDKLDAKMDK
jgi:uncharacterized protein HemY